MFLRHVVAAHFGGSADSEPIRSDPTKPIKPIHSFFFAMAAAGHAERAVHLFDREIGCKVRDAEAGKSYFEMSPEMYDALYQTKDAENCVLTTPWQQMFKSRDVSRHKTALDGTCAFDALAQATGFAKRDIIEAYADNFKERHWRAQRIRIQAQGRDGVNVAFADMQTLEEAREFIRNGAYIWTDGVWRLEPEAVASSSPSSRPKRKKGRGREDHSLCWADEVAFSILENVIGATDKLCREEDNPTFLKIVVTYIRKKSRLSSLPSGTRMLRYMTPSSASEDPKKPCTHLVALLRTECDGGDGDGHYELLKFSGKGMMHISEVPEGLKDVIIACDAEGGSRPCKGLSAMFK